jgi:hypothetical protein
MASTGPGRPRRWLARARRACVLAVAVASVAGCVGMPNSGSPGTFSATPQDTTPNSDFIGAIPAGPAAKWQPWEIVTGFLNASASYPVYSAVAKEYLVGAASKSWDPHWSVQVVDQVSVPRNADFGPGGKQATVNVTGTLRASFNGTGQYVGAQAQAQAQQKNGGTQEARWPFRLVKVDGQWRITNPPPFRMLTEPDFSQVYKPQDLYFFDSTSQVLVPDSVFVPAGTSPTQLVTNLVEALLRNPQTPWLLTTANPTPPAITEFPPGETTVNVAVDGTTATVNLGGAAAGASQTTRGQIAAQLVWTLTGQQTGPPNIQAVLLEFNGKPWTPLNPPCPGAGGQSQSAAQKLAMYSCKNPYPAATSSAFYYVGNGQAWSRCASRSQVMTGFIGSVLPVFSRSSAAALGQSCGPSVQASSPAAPPAPLRGRPPLSMIAVSPDGKYTAGVSANGRAVNVWASGDTKPSSTLPTSGVTAIGWDRRDYLWVTQNDTTTLLVQTNSSSNNGPIPNSYGEKITGLSIAPDGVRVAAIVQTQAGPQVQLAAIDSGTPATGQPTGPFSRTSIGPTVQLGPNVTNPIALTWYDADNLLVIDGRGTQTTLWDVPVDGQPATELPGVLPGAVSITANSAQNVLVVGLSSGRMDVSASLEGPWQPLGGGGQNPAFPIPVIPVAAQS